MVAPKRIFPVFSLLALLVLAGCKVGVTEKTSTAEVVEQEVTFPGTIRSPEAVPTATVQKQATVMVTPKTTAILVTPVSPPGTLTPSGDLAIGFAFSPSFADYLNQVGNPKDFAAAGLPGLEGLAKYTVGNKVLMFGSLQRLQAYPIEALRQVDIIGFDLERGAVPAEEQADLVETVRKAHDFAREHGLKLLLAPVARWTEEYGPQLAPYADIIVMQMMRYQHDPELFAAKVKEYSQKLREANPDLVLFVQVSTQREQTPEELYQAIKPAQADLDGIWIQWHYRDDGRGPKEGLPNIEEVREFIELIRPSTKE